MIQIKQIGIPSLGVKPDGKVTPENTQTDEFISTEVDPNKWGVTLASSAQNILHKTSVSKEPEGAVFITLIARNLCPMTHDKRSPHPQSVKHEKLIYDVLQSIINLAAEGSEWLQHVFVHVDEPLTLLVHSSALPIVASTIISLAIRKSLNQTRSADASFNLGLLQDHGFIESDISDQRILHISKCAEKLKLLKDDPTITTASGFMVKRPKTMDEACKMIGGLYDCVSLISKFAHLTSDRLHIFEKRLNAVSICTCDAEWLLAIIPDCNKWS